MARTGSWQITLGIGFLTLAFHTYTDKKEINTLTQLLDMQGQHQNS